MLKPSAFFRILSGSRSDHGFTDLKNRFSTAPILIQPDLTKQFIVEVDASDSEVGAVLSQRSEKNGKLHLSATVSHRVEL